MAFDRAALEQGARYLQAPLASQQADLLVGYGEMILRWNKVYNLTALRDPQRVLTHHLLDSLAVCAPLARVLPPSSSANLSLLDVGSGAGLPGAVIAVLRPDVEVTCVDAVAKKAAFVQQVAAELKLSNLRGVHARVEAMAGSYRVVCSRAFATLAQFTSLTAHLLTDGVWMAMKGRDPAEEIAALPSSINAFHVEQLVVPGLDAERCIVWARRAS